MKKFGFAALIAGSLTAATLGLAGTQAIVVADPGLPHYSVDNNDDTYTTNGFADQAI